MNIDCHARHLDAIVEAGEWAMDRAVERAIQRNRLTLPAVRRDTSREHCRASLFGDPLAQQREAGRRALAEQIQRMQRRQAEGLRNVGFGSSFADLLGGAAAAALSMRNATPNGMQDSMQSYGPGVAQQAAGPIGDDARALLGGGPR